jgi:hypothetical protein
VSLCPDERWRIREHRRDNRVELLEALCQGVGDPRRIPGGGGKACGGETTAALDRGPGRTIFRAVDLCRARKPCRRALETS